MLHGITVLTLSTGSGRGVKIVIAMYSKNKFMFKLIQGNLIKKFNKKIVFYIFLI